MNNTSQEEDGSSLEDYKRSETSLVNCRGGIIFVKLFAVSHWCISHLYRHSPTSSGTLKLELLDVKGDSRQRIQTEKENSDKEEDTRTN